MAYIEKLTGGSIKYEYVVDNYWAYWDDNGIVSSERFKDPICYIKVV